MFKSVENYTGMLVMMMINIQGFNVKWGSPMI